MNEEIIAGRCGTCGIEISGGLSYFHLRRSLVCNKCGKAVCFKCVSNKINFLIKRKRPLCKKCFEENSSRVT